MARHKPRTKNAISERPAGVLFHALVYGGTGYAEEAWPAALGVAERGVPVQLATFGEDRDTRELLPVGVREKLEHLQRVRLDLARSVYYQCATADMWNMECAGRCRIGRTMFETDRIPEGWAERCQSMDEVWVPSQFNLETFAGAGVPEKKLRIVHAGVDANLFRPGVPPLQIPERRGFNFLSVFDWHPRKGFDVLFHAYLTEFKPDEDVALILKVYQVSDPVADLQTKISYFVEREVGIALEKCPPIILVNGFIPQEQMPALYAAADVFVLPTRGEGYGRPYMEAQCCELPVLATRWSGQLDFLDDENSYLIDIEGVIPAPWDVDMEYYAGHCWAQPSMEHLRQLMRHVFSHREDARQRAACGRRSVTERFAWSVIQPRWADEFRRLLA